MIHGDWRSTAEVSHVAITTLLIDGGNVRVPGDGFLDAPDPEDVFGEDVEVVVEGSSVVLVGPPHLGFYGAYGQPAGKCWDEAYVASGIHGPEPAGQRRQIGAGAQGVVPVLGDDVHELVWVG